MIRNSSFGPRLVREYNELNILRFIKNEGPISRADIAKRYKISKAAVSEIISHLLAQGYVFETGMGNSTRLGGRKPIMLEFNPQAGYAIGVEIRRDNTTVALGDLNGKILNSTTIKFQAYSPLPKILDMIFSEMDKLREIPWVKKAKPTGIGVAIPGVINYRSGKIQESDTLKQWQGFPLRDTFEERYNIDTLIENDVKAISLAESRFGGGSGAENQIFLWIGDGLGAGIIINGELYRGISAGAGEIGYFKPGVYITDSGRFKYLYNDHKTFGDLLSEKVLLSAAERELKNGNMDMCTFLELVEAEDTKALAILKEYAELVGILCINLINTLNPELILIGGHELARNKTLIKYISREVKQDTLKTPSKAVLIRSASIKKNSGILGAIALILEDIFYMERLNIQRYRDVFGFKR